MHRLVTLALALLAARSSAASPTVIDADLSYGTGRFSALDVSLFVLRAEATHALARVSFGGSLSFVRASSMNEGETDGYTALSNPALRVRYALRLPAVELGLATGFIVAVGDDFDRAKLIAGTFEAIRHPYEHSRASAVPLIADALGGNAHWRWHAAAGVYFVTDDGPQLDEVHLTVGAAYALRGPVIGVQLHALFVPPAAASPVQYEPIRRAYYGIEAYLGWQASAWQRIHVGIWKPFGYDNSDSGDGMTALAAGTELRF